MKKLAAIVALLAVAALAAFTVEPKPKTPNVALETRVEAGSVWFIWAVTATGGPDKLSVALTVNGAAQPGRDYTVSGKKDSLSVARPAPLGTVTFGVTPTSWRRALSATGATVTKTYTEPDTPPPAPTVDSVRVAPVSLNLAPGQRVTLTAIVFKS